jgi:hypothetical protein
MTITAAADAETLFQWLSFRTHVFTANPEATVLENARVGRVGEIDQFGTSSIESSGGGCNFVASAAHRCVRIFLDRPLRIPAGTSTTLCLRMNVSGTLVNGELLETTTVTDNFGSVQGPLTGGHIDSQFPNNMMWSNDGLWWYNGYSVHWGSHFTQVLGYHDP